MKSCHIMECVVNYQWIHGFLLGRTQQVVLNGCKSCIALVSPAGVLQGTVLGPLLFCVMQKIFQNVYLVILDYM